MPEKSKILIVLGPTATGKITKKEMRGMKHHLLDVTNPKKRFTVSEYINLANRAIAQIIKRGKLPIVCGGTGFYIDALLGDKQIPEVPPNQKLREKLEKKSVEELFETLKKLDPERASTIDKQNPRRLIRAIEICKALGSVPKLVASSQHLASRKYDVLKIGIAPIKEITHPHTPSLILREGAKGKGYILNDKELENRINKRIEKWFKGGLLKEVLNLHKKGLSWKRMSEIGLEYKIVSLFLSRRSKSASRPNASGQNKISKEDMIKRMQIETRQYSKRQMTWFKKDKNIIWLPPKINLDLIEKGIRRFLEK